MGLFRYGQFILFFTGFINIVLDVVFGKRWGILGILLATLAARCSTNLWYEPYAVFKYGFKMNPWEYWKRYFKNLLVLGIAGTLSFICCGFCHFQAGINVIVKVIICSVIPNMVFLLFYKNSSEFSYLIAAVRRIIGMLLNRLKRR